MRKGDEQAGGAALFGGKPNEESALDTVEARERHIFAVKREKEEDAMNHVLKKARMWGRELASSSIVIDLDSGSQEEAREPNHDDNPECAHEGEKDADRFRHGFAMYQEE